MDITSILHRQARELSVLDWARDLCNAGADDWEGCLRFVVLVELARLDC